MKQFVQSLTNKFIAEAKSSPTMFEDLASMEHYMAESYDGRTFVEILQNADDANATSLILFSQGTDFVFANNGRPFNQEDLVAICRSGASSKSRGKAIGYRGIGFKSATSISTEIIIYSSGVYFSFSKSRCAKEMKKSVDRVPTVRIPFLVEETNINDALKQAINKYEENGYTTFFIFKKGNKDKLLAELTDLSSGWLLFLNHIENVTIDLPRLSKKVEIRRKSIKANQYLFTDKKNRQSWLIIHGENNTAIAFKYDLHIVPCGNDESLFHCFLPTLDSLGYPFKANADFSTDPSRKHIIINDDITKRSIENIAELIVELLSDTSFENQPYLINLIASRSGISSASAFLDQQIISLLKTVSWIPLQSGKQITATECRIVPYWFDSDSRKKVFNNVHSLGKYEIKTSVTDSVNNLDDLLLRCGCQPYGFTEFSAILGNIDVVAKLNDVFLGKLWGYFLRSVLYSLDSKTSFFLKDRTNNIIDFSMAQKPVDFSDDFRSGLKGILNNEELIQVAKHTAFNGIESSDTDNKKKKTSEKKSSIQLKLEYSKWKTPIQNCMVSEQLQGRSPKDVSKKGLGYDIESIEQNGEIKYFSVKPVESLGNSFILSEKEYSWAEQHSSNYGVYVIENGNPENNMIVDNIGGISFEKRVREYEYVSGQYEVVKKISQEEILNIDSKFIKEFSLKYLNSIQIAFLRIICDGGNIASFEEEYSCKAKSIIAQINTISDFYLGDILIEDNLSIKGKYLGGLNYLLKQSE